MHLTDISIRTLKTPEDGQITYTDDALPGFGIRVSSGGSKSFVLVHGPQRTRTTIGRYPVISLAQARAKAKEVLAQRTLGILMPRTITFEAAFERYIPTLEKTNKPSSIYTTKRLLAVHFLPRFRNEKLSDIAPEAIAKKIAEMKDTPSEARHAYMALHGFFHWCELKGYVENNPCKRVEAPRNSPSRTRVLTDQELTKVASCAILGATGFHKITALLLLTGQRRGQIGGLRGEWIDRDQQTIVFPASIMKGNRIHYVPYGHKAGEIIAALPETGLVFPALGTQNAYNAFSKPKIAFDKECGVKDWTLHDLRRTLRTNLAKLKVPPHIGERILDHRTAVATEVEGIYDRYLYLDEMREALTRYEDHLAKLTSDKGDARSQDTHLPREHSCDILSPGAGITPRCRCNGSLHQELSNGSEAAVD